MSALGQKRTLERLYTMSALPPKADIGTGSITFDLAAECRPPARGKSFFNLFPLP